MFNWLKKEKVRTQTEAFSPIFCGVDEELFLDVNSPTWKFIKGWLEEELATARKRNDKQSLTHDKTSFIRGEIQTLKNLANLPAIISSRDNRLSKSTPPVMAGGDDYGTDE